jgi:hypothetical protein
MTPPSGSCSRRSFLQWATAAAAGRSLAAERPAATMLRLRSQPPPPPRRPRRRLAVITTIYHYRSHSYHICGRFLFGYLRNGQMHYPDHAIVSMYVDQVRGNDLSRELSRQQGFTLYPSVEAALTCGGTRLAVDGVLLIAEQGDYPFNERGQQLYPRYEFFQRIVGVFRRSGRSVPVFCDKHLSYDRRRAREMVQTAQTLGFPLMCGSSLPVTWRRPELELPLGTPIREALVVGYGPVDAYGFHALEALQCLVERRLRQGQQGVRAVTCLEGDAVWEAGERGDWSWELLEHALGRSPSRNVGDVRVNCRQYPAPANHPGWSRGPLAYLLEYRDGLRAAVLLLNGHVADFTFAARLAGQERPVSTLFYLPPPPGAAFLEALTTKIEQFLTEGRSPTPVARTLLTGGILDAALESRARGHRRLETPDLEVSYAPPADSGFLRGDYIAPA